MDMNDIYKIHRENFINNFSSLGGEYSEPIVLLDTMIGISIFKEQNELGRKDFKSLFRIYIKDEELKKESGKKPLIITAAYGKIGEYGLTTGSDDFKISSDWPAELSVIDEFFYDIKNDKIYQKDKVITVLDLLNTVNKYHIKPTRLIIGFKYRAKLNFLKTCSEVLKFLFYIVSGTQFLFSGKKINFYLMSKDSISIPMENGKKLNIFDYVVEVWVGTVYAMAHLLIYLLFYYNDIRPLVLIKIFNNSFLTVMYVIVSLGLFDSILSRLPRFYITRKTLTFLKEKYIQVVSVRIKV